ncbi:MAG: MATE family efflux transporter [Spirochaetae bacterium HGW-Spirochaetae-1]|jgi:MATE family multidrug resistance protein|nr:MAG: MATE family efflux transporter [Spirochaetae bacterium HGW-Spirochaetae-1]
MIPIISTLSKRFLIRWNAPFGYRHLLVLAIPLIISTGSWSIQHVIDRMFLTWHSEAAIAASMPAGILNFTIISFFMGTASYVSTFVAQYFGSDQHKMVGPIVWQGMYVSLMSAFTLFMLIPFAPQIFTLIGHDEAVRILETDYFQILCFGGFPVVASSCLAGLFSGLGKTWIVMFVNIFSTIVNIVFNYLLIFGNYGFPAMGIRGAGIATVISACVNFLIYFAITLGPYYRSVFDSVRGWRFNRVLFMRLMKYGLPSGAQFFLDVAGFTFFILIIGRLGKVSLAASNIALTVNNLAFMPMIGLGIAVSILVGQNLGRNEPENAEYSAYSGFHLTFIYMTAIAALFVFFPEIFIGIFAAKADPEKFRKIFELTVILLRFVAFYSVFDTLNIIFASAIKGAGDTRFVMYMISSLSLTVLVIPTYVCVVIFEMGLYAGWTIASAYVILLGFVFLLRFKNGKWKKMRVIDMGK